MVWLFVGNLKSVNFDFSFVSLAILHASLTSSEVGLKLLSILIVEYAICITYNVMSMIKLVLWWCHKASFNSSLPSAAYMPQWTGSALVQIMACRVDGAEPSYEPILTLCQLHPGNIFQWNLFEIQTFSFKKMGLNMSSVKWRSFCSGGVGWGGWGGVGGGGGIWVNYVNTGSHYDLWPAATFTNMV